MEQALYPVPCTRLVVVEIVKKHEFQEDPWAHLTTLAYVCLPKIGLRRTYLIGTHLIKQSIYLRLLRVEGQVAHVESGGHPEGPLVRLQSCPVLAIPIRALRPSEVEHLSHFTQRRGVLSPGHSPPCLVFQHNAYRPERHLPVEKHQVHLLLESPLSSRIGRERIVGHGRFRVDNQGGKEEGYSSQGILPKGVVCTTKSSPPQSGRLLDVYSLHT